MILWQPKRRGFTLFQLLALLALFAYLLGLLLPVVARVRQMALRMEAQNNLRQLALAMHNCHATYNKTPPAVGNFPDAKTEGTLFFHLLPFLEEQELYRNAKGDVWHGGTAAQVVKVFLNPADTSGPPDHVYRGYLATASFAANWMAFGTKGARIPASFPDGTSNTIVYAERYQMCDGQPNAWAYPAVYYRAPIFAYYSDARFQVAPDPASKECDVRLAQTPFREGMLAALCDGSVRLLSPNLSWTTYRAVLTPAGGEVLGADWDQ
jgi:hypothetical protein